MRLQDFNYIFWAGHWEPQTIILLCMGVLVGYVVGTADDSISPPSRAVQRERERGLYESPTTNEVSKQVP
eukprot:520098-Amphidinium_carterae.1